MILGLAATRANADVIYTVGSTGQDYTTVSDAVAAADAGGPSNYYVIEVNPGTYTNDFPDVTTAMTIEVNPSDPGTVLLNAIQSPPNNKGIIETTASLTVNGLTLQGAMVSLAEGQNGAGIRDEATGTATLDVENSTFTNDQDGILADPNLSENIIINGSTFISDGFDAGSFTCSADGCDHAIYINGVNSLDVSNSIFCGTIVGHDIKSRAENTTITDNQLYDGAPDPAINCPAGSTSYAIDLANGGDVTISGNQIIQGPDTQNPDMVSYGEEGLDYSDNSLLLTNNDFTNTDAGTTIGVNDTTCSPVTLQGNSFVGVTIPVNPPSCVVSNTGTGSGTGTGSVPEPSSLLVLLSALVGCFVIRTRSAVRA
jgi:hypothetical protein